MQHPSIHLPTELVVLIVSFAAIDEPHARQRTLHACCLVSRQWYSTAIALLFERPVLDSGTSFQKFSKTISPPIGARKSKINLGSLVHRLDLSGLVHHSSPSLTARLLGRVKENLEVLIAPRVSFSTNSLPALSKCHHLRHLDLSLVGDPLAFPSLKTALSKLTHLTSLRLPQSTNLTTNTDSAADWPPHLSRLQLSGRFSATEIPLFQWPPALTSLTLKNCADLSVENLGSLISSPHLNRSLRRLTISGFNRSLSAECINAIPAFLPDLTFLSVPGDLVEDAFFDMMDHMSPPLALEVLQFGYPHLDATVGFKTDALLHALGTGLYNLRSVEFAEVFCTEERIQEDEDIDEALLIRGANRGAAQFHEEDYGVVYI